MWCTADIPSQIEYDLLHMNTVHNWIAGKYANGTATADGKPFNLFGTSLQVTASPRKPQFCIHWPHLDGELLAHLSCLTGGSGRVIPQNIDWKDALHLAA